MARLRVKSVHSHGDSEFRTLVQLSRGNTVVLGQNVARDAKSDETVALFYIVNAAMVH